MVRGAKNACDEDQADDHIQPFLQDLAVGTGQPDQKIGQETTLNHFPYAFHPQVNRPPAVEDGDGVIFKLQQGRQIQQCGKAQAQHQYPLGGREAARLPDRHANVVEENQHADDNHDLVRQRLLKQLVAGPVPEQVADNGRHTHHSPQDELDVGELDAMEFST